MEKLRAAALVALALTAGACTKENTNTTTPSTPAPANDFAKTCTLRWRDQPDRGDARALARRSLGSPGGGPGSLAPRRRGV